MKRKSSQRKPARNPRKPVKAKPAPVPAANSYSACRPFDAMFHGLGKLL